MIRWIRGFLKCMKGNHKFKTVGRSEYSGYSLVLYEIDECEFCLKTRKPLDSCSICGSVKTASGKCLPCGITG